MDDAATVGVAAASVESVALVVAAPCGTEDHRSAALRAWHVEVLVGLRIALRSIRVPESRLAHGSATIVFQAVPKRIRSPKRPTSRSATVPKTPGLPVSTSLVSSPQA